MNKPKRLIMPNVMELTSTGYWEIFRFELEPLAPGEEAIIELPVNGLKGNLTEVSLETQSKNLDLSILAHPTANVPSIDCLYTKTGINQVSQEASMQKLWARCDYKVQNTSGLSAALFAKVKNNDTISSGETVLEIVAQLHSA